jgi:hypothetical protein
MGRAYKGPSAAMPGMPAKVLGGGKGMGAERDGPGQRGLAARGGFGRGGPAAELKGKVRKDRGQRFGKLKSEADKMENGKYIPWASAQAPGSVKEVTFNAEGRAAYLTGFRKRKAERQTFAKKTISDKERNELRKEKREKKAEMLVKYDARVAEMKKIAAEAHRLQQKEANQESDSDDSDSSDGSDSEEEAPMHIAPEKKVMEFGDARRGTATVVEVKEMDLSDFHESASAFASLPALPKVDHTKISKKKRNPNAGSVRYCISPFYAPRATH